jgi:chromosome partitioning protein
MGPEPGEQRIYRPREAALVLGISKERLLELERDGIIPPATRDGQDNRVYTREDLERIRDLAGIRPTIPSAPAVVAVFNMKGGVGKSTVSSNLAWWISELGFRTLAVDADPQGHMTTSLGQEPSDFQTTLQELLVPGPERHTHPVEDVRMCVSPTLHLIPANLSMCTLNLLLFQQPEREYRMRRTIEEIRRGGLYDYDTIIIDSPPSYDLTSLNILLACDFLLAPVKLDGNSFYGLQYLFDTIRDLIDTYRYRIPQVLIAPNHYNHSYSVSRQILGGLKENYGEYVADTVVRQDVSFDKANALREPIFVSAPSSKGSKDLEALAEELLDKLHAGRAVAGDAATMSRVS